MASSGIVPNLRRSGEVREPDGYKLKRRVLHGNLCMSMGTANLTLRESSTTGKECLATHDANQRGPVSAVVSVKGTTLQETVSQRSMITARSENAR